MYLGKNAGLELSEVEKLTSHARRCEAKPESVARSEGEYWVAADPNSFALPAVTSCPGKTGYCEVDCYAIDSEYRPKTREKAERNHKKLQEAVSVECKAELLRDMLKRYHVRADTLKLKPERIFRIHWDGDFDSVDYARAWNTVIPEFPETEFWVYTRSFDPGKLNVLGELSGLENLSAFASVDAQNVDVAAKILPDYPDIRVAYLVDYFEDAESLSQILGRTEDAGFRILACPENMYSEKKQGERKQKVISKRGGACSVCTYCIDKPETWDVVFVKKHLYENPQKQLIETAQYVELSRSRKRTRDRGDIEVPIAQVILPTLFDTV